MRTVTPVVRRAGLVIVALVGIVDDSRAASCARDCVRRMAECRAQQCAGLSAKHCRDQCRAITGCRAGGARIRTLATVVSECQASGGQWSGRQRLEIKRGDCPATIVSPIESNIVRDTNRNCDCEAYGRYRDGASAVVGAAFQRLGVSPDGRTVLFELNTLLEGTNVEKGRELLAGSGLKITPATGLTDAASKVVKLAGGGR